MLIAVLTHILIVFFSLQVGVMSSNDWSLFSKCWCWILVYMLRPLWNIVIKCLL